MEKYYWYEMSYNVYDKTVYDRLSYENCNEEEDEFDEEFLYNVYCDIID